MPDVDDMDLMTVEICRFSVSRLRSGVNIIFSKLVFLYSLTFTDWSNCSFAVFLDCFCFFAHVVYLILSSVLHVRRDPLQVYEDLRNKSAVRAVEPHSFVFTECKTCFRPFGYLQGGGRTQECQRISGT